MKLKTFFPLFGFVALLAISHLSIAQAPRPPYVVSPKVNPDKTVTFSYLAPNATTVLLDGNQFGSANVPMTKGENGVWSITVGPVKPDIYPYGFKVDGTTINDPSNTYLFPNERFKASLVEIPADSPAIYALQNVPHGSVSYQYYPSVEGSTGTVVVYTPAGYTKETAKKYPVYYLISGTTDTEETFWKVGKVNLMLDNMIAQGKAKAMIVVMPYGNPLARIAEQTGKDKPSDVMSRDGEDALKRIKLFETDLITNVIPYIEKNYRTINNRDNRAIGGFSRGGGQTLRTAFNNVDKFAYVCSYASYISPAEMDKSFTNITSNPDKTNKDFKLLFSGIGTEDFLYKGTTEWENYLKDKKINFKSYVTDGGHTWMNVKKYLNETLPVLFK
ncbi:Carbohydrate acetyl esterase/feruloyl esterase [Emticicia aquatica]|uniref:Carbohydrate acetyl esterase/feruloyl esterase n=1 Tax=Emticicia aquatica TaxID=1681835 RepID=A0ABM9AVB0_9BACT|nr:esterase [Emticicia aquatica]CAH0997730.1 Carbohydrate acetyl esterase/feruloyl esterase [Emticicia aquatica]